VITCEAVAVHPFAEVTVTVYVFAAVTFSVEFVPTTAVPFDQEYVPPPVAVNGILVVVQVKVVALGALIPAVGATEFCVIVDDAVAVHPLVPVTVTVYVPGVVTTSAALVPTTAVPFDQEYVPPPVAVNVILVVVHVNTVVEGVVMAAKGELIFCVIV